MASIFKILRSILPRSRPPADINSAGSLYVNFSDAQLGIMDNAGLPLDLLGVRFHKETAGYVVDDIVAYGGTMYRCLVEHDPEVFDSAKWMNLSALIYDYSKVSGILDIPSTYTPIASLTTNDSPNGIYELKMSLSWVFDRTTSSAFFRWRETNETGAFSAWNESTAEPKDKTDTNNDYYAFPKEWAGGVKTIEVEMRKETGAGVLDVNYMDIVWDQKS